MVGVGRFFVFGDCLIYGVGFVGFSISVTQAFCFFVSCRCFLFLFFAVVFCTCLLLRCLLQAENALESEKLRVANYLNPSTEAKLLRVCDDEMLEKRWGKIPPCVS